MKVNMDLLALFLMAICESVSQKNVRKTYSVGGLYLKDQNQGRSVYQDESGKCTGCSTSDFHEWSCKLTPNKGTARLVFHLKYSSVSS